MKRLLIIIFVALALSSCASLNSSIVREQQKYRVFVVDKEPTQCQFIAQINGIGKEPFEGNSRYSIPLAMNDLKRKTATRGANVVYIKKTFKKDFSYVIRGICYRCRTMKVARR